VSATYSESMVEAGKEERRFAIERKDYHQGVPSIMDGGTHKHDYNANSIVVIIIGTATVRLLYLRVRNKYCATCTQGILTERHSCLKNWSSSSSEM